MKKTFTSFIVTLGLLGLLQSCASVEQKKAATENSASSPNALQTSTGSEATQTAAKVESISSQEPPKQFDEAKAKRLTDTARLLAGMKVEDSSELAKIQNMDVWQNHHHTLENSWAQLNKQQLSKVRNWSDKELSAINSTSPTVFYPFSGPDFLYAYSLFPQGKEYIMIGLEPVGTIPTLSATNTGQVYRKLAEARNSLYALLKFSFFRTNDMKQDMANQGVIPVLYTFLARTNNQILDVELVGIDKQGNVQKMAKGMVPGVKIYFVPQGETTPRTLYYFSTDLSNDGLKKTPEFAEFVKKVNSPVTYLKAASYLMYNDSFSTIRNAILTQSNHVLQDDSGMPVKFFAQQKWNLKFYGNYTQPIGLFSNRYQPDLHKIYQSGKSIKPLNFGIGYKFGVNESNLMLANHK
ncbi:hypothetical protein [Gloeothece verrucosa]|uniref:Lipoprotein n=1 Tax=Gloeothece verrucosa (strain PCC 7822) TaxID=497965 RepID=E0UF00_GLOV7|nr:hypothetical protein [Gloeothece verrucosa]ADN14252.1 conserved hypothetical protein [Gloeothece verrucosa PCC 7822]